MMVDYLEALLRQDDTSNLLEEMLLNLLGSTPVSNDRYKRNQKKAAAADNTAEEAVESDTGEGQRKVDGFFGVFTGYDRWEDRLPQSLRHRREQAAEALLSAEDEVHGEQGRKDVRKTVDLEAEKEQENSLYLAVQSRSVRDAAASVHRERIVAEQRREVSGGGVSDFSEGAQYAAQSVDRAFRRDARRYDGEFTLF